MGPKRLGDEYQMRRVYWVDATDHSDIDLEELLDKPTHEFFTKRTTMGLYIKEDVHGIILARDITDDGLAEITAIPKKWKYLTRKQ